MPTRHALPLTLGHEISGVVTAAGAAHAGLVGHEVIVPAVLPCGECDLCRAGRGNACQGQRMPGNDMDGGFAEYVVVPARGLCRVDGREGHDLAELAVIADAVTTPYQAIVRSRLSRGELAIVVGVGGVGAYAVQIAAAIGARVVAIDVDSGRLALMAEHGANLTLDSSTTDIRVMKKQIVEHARAWGCAPYGWRIFECSGHPDGQQTAWACLTHAGTLAVIGFTLARIELRLSNVMAFDATVQGTWGCLPELYPAALELVREGRILLEPFVERQPMSRAPEILQRVAEHSSRKRTILEPDWTPQAGAARERESAGKVATC